MENVVYMERQIIGDNIRFLRKKAILSQSELGEMIGVTGMTISRIESGRGKINMDYLILIAEKLHVRVEDILTENYMEKRFHVA